MFISAFRRRLSQSRFVDPTSDQQRSTTTTQWGQQSTNIDSDSFFMRFLVRNTLLAGYPNRRLEVLRATVLTKLNR